MKEQILKIFELVKTIAIRKSEYDDSQFSHVGIDDDGEMYACFNVRMYRCMEYEDRHVYVTYDEIEYEMI